MCTVSNDVSGIYKNWGQQLRDERRKQQLTQDQVAERAALDHSTVSRVEAGTAGFAGVVAVARALGIDIVLERSAA